MSDDHKETYDVQLWIASMFCASFSVTVQTSSSSVFVTKSHDVYWFKPASTFIHIYSVFFFLWSLSWSELEPTPHPCSMWRTRPLWTAWWKAWTPTETPSATSRSSWHSSPWSPSVAMSFSSTRTSEEEANCLCGGWESGSTVNYTEAET